MHSFTEQFADFCEKNLDLEPTGYYNYESLSACILDCVYSLRAPYFATTVPVKERYAKAYMNGNRQAAGEALVSKNIFTILVGELCPDIIAN